MTDRASSNPTVQPSPPAVLPRISAPAAANLSATGEGAAAPEGAAASLGADGGSPSATGWSPPATGWSPSAWRLGRR